MNEELAFLRYMADRLDEARLPYMLTGSMAMMFYTIPRMTRDIDFVVECRSEDVDRLLEVFQPDCYVSEEVVRDAVARSGMFNIIHIGWAIKADLIVRRQWEFRELEFTRRRTMAVGDLSVAVVSPEDLILSKLDWARDSASASQYQDVTELLSAVPDLDNDYLEHWARLGRPGATSRTGKVMRDTPPAVEAMYRDLLMSRTPADRVRMAARMYDAARVIIRAGIPADCWETEADLRIEVFRRFYRQDFSPEEMERIVKGLRSHPANR